MIDDDSRPKPSAPPIVLTETVDAEDALALLGELPSTVACWGIVLPSGTPSARLQEIVQHLRATGRMAWTGRVVLDDSEGAQPEADRSRVGASSREAFVGRRWRALGGAPVDLMGLLWVVRRFVDARAELADPDEPGPCVDFGEGADLFHPSEGRSCTHALVRHFGLRDPALLEVVRVTDAAVESASGPPAEAPGFRALVEAIARRVDDPAQRMAVAATLFDDLFDHFGAQPR